MITQNTEWKVAFATIFFGVIFILIIMAFESVPAGHVGVKDTFGSVDDKELEPGIYIPEEGFGIRLEDDVVIQPSGTPFNLMKNIPIEADEIESIMNS